MKNLRNLKKEMKKVENWEFKPPLPAPIAPVISRVHSVAVISNKHLPITPSPCVDGSD